LKDSLNEGVGGGAYCTGAGVLGGLVADKAREDRVVETIRLV